MSSESDQLRTTALTGWHLAAGAKMGNFAGWSMPLEYPSGTVTEHRAVRSGCGLFDVSHMGTLRVVGEQPLAGLNWVLTNDLDKLAVGEAQYTMLCDDQGGVVDDMIVTWLSADTAIIVPNAANTAAVRDALESAVRQGSDGATLVDESAATAIFAVQGPKSNEVLAEIGLPSELAYMTAVIATFEGVEVVVSRSGYTGERGYEILAPNERAVALWEAIAVQPIVTPVGLGARDTLRTEMGYALHGQDLSAQIDPVTAGLSWAVGWDKPEFVGRDRLIELKSTGPLRRLRGIRFLERGIPRPGMSVLLDGAEVGEITSGTFSPTLREGIGLALVDASVSLGQAVAVDVRGRSVAAEIVRPPFVPSSPK